MNSTLARIDHLVYSVPDLDRAVAELEQQLGVRATPGGSHPGWGTRNALLSLGPLVYLEIIAPDPAQREFHEPRVFGVDPHRAPALTAWAAKWPDLENSGPALAGDVFGASREQVDGTLLHWHLSDPFTVNCDGLVPFLIDWGDSPHPASNTPGGAVLKALGLAHPEPESVAQQLARLGLEMEVSQAELPAMVATILAASGAVVELR
jgi:hypothetical protein